MAHHRVQRRSKGGGFGTAILFMLLAIGGGSFVAATMDSNPSAARVYLAKDLTPKGVQ